MSVTLTKEEVDHVLDLLGAYLYDGHPWDDDLTKLQRKLEKAIAEHGR